MKPEATQTELRDLISNFHVTGKFDGAVPFGSGHINDTYRVDMDQGGRRVYYILQRINHAVFKHPSLVMENVAIVTRHLQKEFEAAEVDEVSRRCLTLVETTDGQSCYVDEVDETWRMYLFIERTHCLDVVERPEQAWQVSHAFGDMVRRLHNLPADGLHETIPNFHHTRKRFQALVEAVELDPENRAKKAKAEIDFALQREADCDVLLDLMATGELPLRVTHNDTKINNVLIDDDTGEGLCVIDLDTVMPGLSLYDFGDLIRGSTATTVEDDLNIDRMKMDFTLFEAVTSGFLAGANGILNSCEVDHLAFSGRLITMECGIRFLTDYLLGDSYFKTTRLNQNLDRSRTQFKLVTSIEEQEDAMRAFIDGHEEQHLAT